MRLRNRPAGKGSGVLCLSSFLGLPRAGALRHHLGLLRNHAGALRYHFGLLRNLTGALRHHFGLLRNGAGALRHHFGLLRNHAGALRHHFGILRKDPRASFAQLGASIGGRFFCTTSCLMACNV